jgi:hypothetical protein
MGEEDSTKGATRVKTLNKMWGYQELGAEASQDDCSLELGKAGQRRPGSKAESKLRSLEVSKLSSQPLSGFKENDDDLKNVWKKKKFTLAWTLRMCFTIFWDDLFKMHFPSLYSRSSELRPKICTLRKEPRGFRVAITSDLNVMPRLKIVSLINILMNI